MSNVLFSEADKYFEQKYLPNLTPEQRRTLEASQDSNRDDYEMPEELKPLFQRSEDVKGKYKIQLLFGPRRSATATSNLCMLNVYESGGKLNEDQDQLCYFCWDIEKRDVGCRGVIPPSRVHGGVGWCTTCKTPRAMARQTEFIVYNLPTATIAENVYKLFRTLNSDADIYIKHARNDIRKLTEMGQRGLADMQAIEAGRDAVIYPLKHILKDVSNGSNVVHKIDTFLRA